MSLSLPLKREATAYMTIPGILDPLMMVIEYLAIGIPGYILTAYDSADVSYNSVLKIVTY